MNKRQLYAMGEPLGECVTRKEAGRLVCGGGGSGGGTSSTTPNVPEELRPLARLYTQQATAIAENPWQAYSGQRYADLNPTQNMAIGMVQNRALEGSRTMDNAENNLNRMIRGGNTNPYLDKMVGRAQQSVAENYNLMTKPQSDTAMANSGSFGNSGIQQMQGLERKAAAQQMSDIATNMYGGAYESDQGRRMSAIGMAPTFGNAAYNDAGNLLNVGNMQQQNRQNNLDFGYQQFRESQDYPFRQIGATGGVLGQNMGSRTVSSGGGK